LADLLFVVLYFRVDVRFICFWVGLPFRATLYVTISRYCTVSYFAFLTKDNFEHSLKLNLDHSLFPSFSYFVPGLQ